MSLLVQVNMSFSRIRAYLCHMDIFSLIRACQSPKRLKFKNLKMELLTPLASTRTCSLSVFWS